MNYNKSKGSDAELIYVFGARNVLAVIQDNELELYNKIVQNKKITLLSVDNIQQNDSKYIALILCKKECIFLDDVNELTSKTNYKLVNSSSLVDLVLKDDNGDYFRCHIYDNPKTNDLNNVLIDSFYKHI